MPYLIIRKDKASQEESREQLRAKHRKHLASIGKKLISAGATLDIDKKITGGIIILDTNDYTEAESFANNDPFDQLSEKTEVTYFRQRWINGEFLEG